MQFEEIRLKHFRQFADQKIISGLQAGLNIICGSNESGKSTLSAALKAAIFERYNARPLLDRYRPFAMLVSPEVELRFRCNGATYELRKVFSQNKDGEVVLSEVSGRGKWIGHEAEEQVAAMFGTEIAKRGESKLENQGIHGLLWVEQAHSHFAVAPSELAHSSLQGALDEELLGMLGGEHGQAIMQRIKLLRDELLTEHGKPRGDYKKLEDSLGKLRQNCEKLAAELGSYEAQVDELGSAQQRLDQYRQDATLERVEASIAQLEVEWQSVQTLQKNLSQQESALELARARCENSNDKRLARERCIATVVLCETAVTQAQTQSGYLDRSIEPLEQELARNETALLQAIESARQVSAHIELKERHARYLRIAGEIKILQAQFGQAQQLQQQINSFAARAKAFSVSDQLVDALREKETRIRVTEAQLDSVATRLDLHLQPGQHVTIGEASYGGDRSVLITDIQTMHMPGLGRCDIHPGGGEIKALRQQLKQLQESLAATLAQAGQQSTEAAARALLEQQRLQADKIGAHNTLAAIAPQGLAALETRRAELHAEQQLLAEKLNGSEAIDNVDSTELQRQRERAESTVVQLEAELASKRNLIEDSRRQQIEARVVLERCRTDVRKAGETLQEERRQCSDAELQQLCYAAQDELNRIQAAVTACTQALSNAKPEDISAQLDRQQQARQRISGEIQQLQGKTSELRAVLASVGQRGLADALANAEIELAQRQREQHQLQRRAGALDLLYRTLHATSQRARQAVAEPIVNAMRPHLRLLMPAAVPVIDDHFQLTALLRAGAEEPFERLSIGTREQLAVLVRLAYADMLTEKGQPVSVLLDDALVNADDERRERMKDILCRAASRYQIILLTCHPRHYEDAGGHMLFLD